MKKGEEETFFEEKKESLVRQKEKAWGEVPCWPFAKGSPSRVTEQPQQLSPSLGGKKDFAVLDIILGQEQSGRRDDGGSGQSAYS
eukprot:2490177-Karenia_brevis.AAC.1